MKRHLTALVTIVALALTGLPGTAVEAQDKNSDDVIKLLLGAAAVGLLLNQINKNKNTNVARRTVPSYNDDDDWENGGYGQHARRGLIPSECVLGVNFDGRNREVVSARCLREFGLTRNLPKKCAYDIRTGAGVRTVYGPICLRDNGYRIGQARY